MVQVAILIIGACTIALLALNGLSARDMDKALGIPPRDGGDVTISNADALRRPNVAAFLKMIRYAEGTSGANGYRMLFGGALFDSFTDHPRRVVTALSNGTEIKSSAAGAYQILKRTWDAVRADLPDFSPASQDLAAVELLRRRRALAFIFVGDIENAIAAARKEWASLPGAGYGQPERNLGELLAQYRGAGGATYA